MKITFALGEENKTFEIVVKGDVNGDGNANLADIFIMNVHRLGKESLIGIYEKAGDIDKNKEVNLKDIFALNIYRLKKTLEL